MSPRPRQPLCPSCWLRSLVRASATRVHTDAGGRHGSPCMVISQNSRPLGATAYTRLTRPGLAAQRCGAHPTYFRQGVRLGWGGGAGLSELRHRRRGGRDHLRHPRPRLCHLHIHRHCHRRCFHHFGRRNFLPLHRRRPGLPPHVGGGFYGCRVWPGQNLIGACPVGAREYSTLAEGGLPNDRAPKKVLVIAGPGTTEYGSQGQKG